MAESLFASLLHTVDMRSISDIAGRLGESESTISRGLESSIATVLGGMAAKSGDSGALRRMLDLVPGNSGEASWSNLASSLASPNSPWIAGGKRILSGLFGSADSTVMNAVGRESGLAPGKVMTLLAMAAPMVMSFLSKKVRDNGMTMSGLGDVLNRESATIRSALPAGLADVIWPRATATASPVVAQAVKRESLFPGWIAALALGAVALGCLWLFTHVRRPATQLGSAATGTASRLANEALNLGDFVKRRLPNNVELNIPSNGVESRLLVFLQDPNASVGAASWFDFDRLVFDSGSAMLRPESREQLDNVAAILKAYPNVQIKMVGYTDNVGSAERNLALSQARANSVKAELVARGISPDRLTAEGMGDQGAAADNTTAAGRAQNRRVSLQVTQK